MTVPQISGQPAPRYAQVAAQLRAAIVAGDYADGSALPTESALCAQHGVSRFTVREALRRLQAEGLIRRRRGSGTVVDTGGQALRQSLSDFGDLLQYAAGSKFAIQPRGMVMVGPERAHEIGVAAGESWFHIAGVRRNDATPPVVLAVTDVYIHRDLADFAGQLQPSSMALFRQLERLSGVRVARVVQDITAVAAGAHEAAALGVARRSPCLRIVRSYIDTGGRTIEISASVHAGDRFTYSLQIDN
jgi:DNA-binding GntR family transcriptional regulator